MIGHLCDAFFSDSASDLGVICKCVSTTRRSFFKVLGEQPENRTTIVSDKTVPVMKVGKMRKKNLEERVVYGIEFFNL